MLIVKLYVGEKHIATYPDCDLYIADCDHYIYVTPTGAASYKDYVCCWPKVCTSISVFVEEQPDTEKASDADSKSV